MAAYGASDPTTPSNCAAQFESAILDTLATYHLTPNPNPDGVTISTLTDYEVRETQTIQLQTGLPAWWAFTGWDKPPFANPGVIDRPGLDARLLPALACWTGWMAFITTPRSWIGSQTPGQRLIPMN